ncbi:MAG: glutamate--tRNA ligase [Deltaproteobacteria bacterium]|nr:glutamate--tRNA ligase [Deltaproteobacteria bacterium]
MTLNIVTRFAPSPTGHLHIGGARTAIFCWLLARHFNGKFLLRIEDTDTERSKQEYTDSILASMNWLNLAADGEITYQSKRLDLYNEYVDRLLASGHAYWCSCTPEEVEAMREEARASGAKPLYNGRCRDKNLGPGPGRVVRLKAPAGGQIVFNDMIKGSIAVDAGELDDMVLRRADGAATYNMAVVVDDALMQVTHVLRGDDHVNNTPKQILLYEALGLPVPVFGHVPMILGSDRQKLSKRHGAKAVIEYQQDGLLPEALINYLVRLGWSHGDMEIFAQPELIKLFDGKNLSSAAAGFDQEKLLWVNAQHLHAKSPKELAELVLPFTLKLQPELCAQKATIQTRIEQFIPLFQSRSSTLTELAQYLSYLLVPADKLQHKTEDAQKTLTPEGKDHLKNLYEVFKALPEFDKESTHLALNKYVTDSGAKFKVVAPPLRVSLLGFMGGPDLAEIMQALGREETLNRITQALKL